MNRPITSSLLIASSLLFAQASLAAPAGSEVEALVRSTLAGRSPVHIEGAAGAVSADAPDAGTITRRVLAGQSIGQPSRDAKEAVSPEAGRSALHANSLELVQLMLRGHAS